MRIPLIFCKSIANAVRQASAYDDAANHLAVVMRNTFRHADAANKRVEDYVNKINSQWKDPYENAYIPEGLTRGKSEFDGLGNLVQPPVVPTRGNGGQADPHGKREAAERSGNDVRDVDNEQVRQTFAARWEKCENYKCPDNADRNRCLDRQRAGMCPSQSGSGD